MVISQALDEVWHKATKQHTRPTQHNTQTHRHLRLRNGPVKWPQRCGSLRGARPIGQTDRQTILLQLSVSVTSFNLLVIVHFSFVRNSWHGTTNSVESLFRVWVTFSSYFFEL